MIRDDVVCNRIRLSSIVVYLFEELMKETDSIFDLICSGSNRNLKLGVVEAWQDLNCISAEIGGN